MDAVTAELLGQIVIYRSAAGVDMPGLITGIILHDGEFQGDVHLECFSAPQDRKDVIDPSWGAAHWNGHGEPGPGTWRERNPQSTQ